LWSYIKSIVYKTPPTSAEDMKSRITNICRSIPQNILISTVENFVVETVETISARKWSSIWTSYQWLKIFIFELILP